MALSVIVTSYESPATLRLCLESLTRQTEAGEIVVSDCSREDPAQTLQELFPAVRFLHFAKPCSVPQLRWAALAYTAGDIVAATEARCIPAATWCGDLRAAHAAAPDSPAVGGTVAINSLSSRFDQALYFCEYGTYGPPVREGPATTISGANLSYKRSELEDCADLIQEGAWETLLHQRWTRAGRLLWQCSAEVTFHNSMSVGKAFRQRWYYGRGYAGDRIQKSSIAMRAALALASLGLPLLLFIRIARDAARRGNLVPCLRASGWILALSTAWAWGETTGYMAGKSGNATIF